MLLSGNTVAKSILNATKLRIQESGIQPGIGVILVGSDAASHLYVGIKEKRAKELGIYFEKKVFPADSSQEEIQSAITAMNKNEKLQGIIVQIPLPDHLDTEGIIATIDPEKDTDGFHPRTIEKFLAGDADRLPVFPRAMLELARAGGARSQFTEQKQALAIVNSDLMGRVLQRALTQEGFSAQYVFGSEKEKITELEPEQSVILTAVGNPGIISAESAQMGAVLIDGGIFYDEAGNVVGDVRRDDGVYRQDVWVTPVPGGVGPVTVAVLLARVTEAALREK